MQHQKSESTEPFKFAFTDPFKSFHDGKPRPIPYVIDGLLTQGGFSVLGGKSKMGKSSLARYEAVCVAKGVPFLGRDTVQGEVLYVNLEDPINHVDNCLAALGYDPAKDARIRIVERVAPTLTENIAALESALVNMPDVRLVIIDTLPKFILVQDINEYMPVLKATEQLHHLAKKFSHLHIQGLAHCKKLKTDDVFDSLLGSSALRGATDTNLALYMERGQRVITTETRIGRSIAPTIVVADTTESAGADVVKSFSLDKQLAELQAEHEERSELKRKVSHEERIIVFLQGQENKSEWQERVLANVPGKRTYKIAAIEALKEAGVLTITGVKQSPTNPLTLHLNEQSLRKYDFINSHGGRLNQ